MPLDVFTLDESCHSHLSNAIHSHYRSHLPPRNAPPLCAELEPLCVQTFSRRYRDLSSPCFHAPREIHFSSFIEALAHISITCLFFGCFTHPDGTNEPPTVVCGGCTPCLSTCAAGWRRPPEISRSCRLVRICGVRKSRQKKGKLSRSYTPSSNSLRV